MPDYLPYLALADPAGHFLPGYQAGAAAGAARANRAASLQEAKMRIAASMAEARMRSGEASARIAETARQADMDYQIKQQQLAEAAKRSAMEVAIEREKMQSQMMLQDQRLAIQDQYRQIQLGLQAERLAETKRVNEEKTLRAARQYAARRQFAEAAQQPGFDAIKTAMSIPDLDLPASSIATLAGKQPMSVPEDVKVFKKDGEMFYVQGNKVVHVPGGGARKELPRYILQANASDEALIRDTLRDYRVTPDKKKKEEYEKMITDARKRIADRTAYGEQLMGGSPQAAAKARPKWKVDEEGNLIPYEAEFSAPAK